MKQRSSLTAVQHDALITGGAFSVVGGLIMMLSITMVLVDVGGSSLTMLDLIEADAIYALAPAISFLGAAILVLSIVSIYRTLRPGKARSGAPLVETLLSITVSLMVIALVLTIQDDYQGADASYGLGAFIDVIGAILAITGALLIQLASGRAAKAVRPAAGFKALAERSERGTKEWNPPEPSVKRPVCPSCGEEVEPGWKACPSCGHAFIGNDLDHQDRL